MRKLSAHYVFPVEGPPLEKGIVHIDDDGTILELIDTGGKLREEASLEFYNGIIVPGFVNAHCHLELSHLKELVPERTGLEEFLLKINRERHFDRNHIRARVAEAHAEMLRNGIMGVGDICNTADSFGVKGNGDISYVSFLEVFGLNPQEADGLIKKAMDLAGIIEREVPHPHFMVPHAPYTMSESLFVKLSLLVENQISSIHNQECQGEFRLFKSHDGPMYELLLSTGPYIKYWKPKSHNPLAHALNFLSGARKILLVHNTYSTKDDVLLAEKGPPEIIWVLCPNANLYIEDKLPDLPLLTARDQTIALGTDSLASNHGLSILEEMKTLHRTFTEATLQNCIRWGTLNGARALDLDHTLGSIRRGKKPGLNLIYDMDLWGLKFNPETKVRKLA